MEPNTQEVPGYFVWEAPGNKLVVHLKLDVVDRLGSEVMRGFGLVPKRGAEVGGVLLGAIEKGEKTIVRIDDWQAVACEYGRGPSFLLSDLEQDGLAMVVESARSSSLQPVGYYRSHTRDGALQLGTEDLELIDKHFPGESAMALLIKPFATKVSMASFFVREGGSFPTEAPGEFPFRRREILGEEAPARRSMYERAPRLRGTRGDEESFERPQPSAPSAENIFAPPPPSYSIPSEPPPEPPRKTKSWVWFPLSFIFLVLGVALGFQAALTFAPELRDRDGARAFQLNLSAGRNGDSLTVRWDRDSPAVRAADRGVLEIEDAGFSKPVPLDQAHLREGSVIYQNSSQQVTFRLVIYIGQKVTVNETVEWAQ